MIPIYFAHGKTQSSSAKLSIVNYKSYKSICNENSLFHSNTLFCDLGILKLFDLMKLRISIITFKANNELLPDNLKQFVNVKYAILYVTCQSNKLKHICTNNF